MARKKKKVQKEFDTGPSEFRGWSVGGEVWFPRTDTATPHNGTIKRFYPDDKGGPCVCVWDNTNGGFRTLPIDFIFEVKKEAKESRQSFIEFWDNYRSK